MLPINVKFDPSTRGRISFAHLFKLSKHIAMLLYLLSPHLLSYMRGSRNVRQRIHFMKMILPLTFVSPSVIQEGRL